MFFNKRNLPQEMLHGFVHAAFVFTCLLIITCGTEPSGRGYSLPPGTLYTADNGDNGDTLKVSLGDTIDVTLQTIGPGEYGTPVISTPVVEFVKNLPVSPLVQNPAGVIQIYRFLATGLGNSKIDIPHSAGIGGVQITDFILIVVAN
jgi:hypothetical protein